MGSGQMGARNITLAPLPVTRILSRGEGEGVVTDSGTLGPARAVDSRSEIVGLARGGGANLLGTAFNQAFRFAITFLLARFLGREDAGLYYQAFAFLAFFGLVSSAGFLVSLTRFVAVHRAEKDYGALRGTVHLGLSVSTGLAVVLGVSLYLSSPWLATTIFDEPRLLTSLRIISIALIPTVFTDAALAATRGFKTMRPYALINLFFEPGFRVTLTIVFLWLGWGLQGAVLALLITNTVAAILAGNMLRDLMGRIKAAPHFEPRKLFSFSVKGWVSSLADNANLWGDIFLLGVLTTASDVGVYVITTRLTLLATLAVGPLSTSVAPRIADLYQRGFHEQLQQTYVLVTSWMVRLALPGFVLLLLFPQDLLRIFGPGFSDGARITFILALAQMIRMATGPSGLLLMMSGQATIVMITDVFGAALNIALNLWLIPRYGITGAAIAWAAEIIVITIISLIEVWWIMHILPFGMGLAKGLTAAVMAFITGFGVSYVTTGAMQLVMGGLTLFLVYVGATFLLGIGPDDRLVLTTVWRGLRPRSA